MTLLIVIAVLAIAASCGRGPAPCVPAQHDGASESKRCERRPS